MPRLLLVYGTNTGNTVWTADAIAASFAKHGLTIPIQDAGYTRPEEVLGRDLLVLGCSTWDNHLKGRYKEGQLQDQMAAFLDQIKQLHLRKMPIAVFGLGDSQYKYYCGAALLLEKFVTEVGGQLVNEPLYIDGQPQAQVDLIDAWSAATVAAWRNTGTR